MYVERLKNTSVLFGEVDKLKQIGSYEWGTLNWAKINWSSCSALRSHPWELCYVAIHQSPAENPPGGTRGRPPLRASCEVDSLLAPWARFSWTAAFTFSTGTWSWSWAWICSTFMFGSVVPMTPFMLEEFCWLYFARGGFALTSGDPNMSEWPPPGGFRTRLDVLLALFRPILNSVELIFSNRSPKWRWKKCSYSCCVNKQSYF